MPIYSSRDTADIQASLADVMAEYHAPLVAADVRVDILAARPVCNEEGDPEEEALKLHGYPCYATIKIRGPKDRGEGRGDALLTYDAYRWDELSDAERRAILDHKLTHLELSVTAKGAVKRDDYGRPKLKMRLHDRQFGWFDSVAARHGSASLERQQAETLMEEPRARQAYFGFMEEQEDAEVTLSTGSKSVTLSAEQFGMLDRVIAEGVR